MSFITDKQTLDDLNLTGKYKANSLFSLFNRVQTAGGERLLEKLFKEPLTDAAVINQRSRLFQYFHQKQFRFPFATSSLADAEYYLSLPGNAVKPFAAAGLLKQKLLKSLVHDEQYDKTITGLQAAITLLQTAAQFLQQLSGYPQPETLLPVNQLLNDSRLQGWQQIQPQQLSTQQVARYHHLLLHVFRHEMDAVLELVYHWDVCIAVAGVAQERGLHYGHALPAGAHTFSCAGLSHPGLTKAVANPMAFHPQQNLLFLTGANMAGKSTLMKSFGIAIYMAHMGFPVAARELRFSVMDGLYTSINVPDNLNQGYSHYYAEVLRVKKVAEEVSRGHNLVVIFDELFKGTNVKDAYDATLAVTEALADYRNCFFIISTHIIEVGDALQQRGAAVAFGYLPTVMEGAVPRYTYTLTTGITNDRQGMMIIQNEGILSLLDTHSN
ncbi:MutS domain III [Filimonas lacunae]|uniref:MutS domain III n=1 Tax=Filimonas lacunae TaxID=477680 RepID=A0A173MH59_9BACT|nr:DNA mismatch repair protein [Filimonas lacunae]BAV06943.1 MutS-related protein, family 1 [Filimonas lacunae]SIS97441.1 MutS domain III [Filimonas lacunae]